MFTSQARKLHFFNFYVPGEYFIKRIPVLDSHGIFGFSSSWNTFVELKVCEDGFQTFLGMRNLVSPAVDLKVFDFIIRFGIQFLLRLR